MESQNKVTTANQQIAKAAGTVMFAYILSSIINLARGIVILRAFGTGMENEAFWAANRVAETLFSLVAGGALASAFVPTFTAFLAKKQPDKAWKLASSIINLALVIISVLAILAAIFAPLIVRYLLAPGFVDDPEKFYLTVRLLRIILPSTVIFSVSGLVMGILNGHQSFLFPALAPSMYSLGMIFGVLVLSPQMGIFGLATILRKTYSPFRSAKTWSQSRKRHAQFLAETILVVETQKCLKNQKRFKNRRPQ